MLSINIWTIESHHRYLDNVAAIGQRPGQSQKRCSSKTDQTSARSSVPRSNEEPVQKIGFFDAHQLSAKPLNPKLFVKLLRLSNHRTLTRYSRFSHCKGHESDSQGSKIMTTTENSGRRPGKINVRVASEVATSDFHSLSFTVPIYYIHIYNILRGVIVRMEKPSATG